MAHQLSHYETLYWIVKLGTLRAAAARLGISQPTVSIRIKEWERELGFRLFKRIGRSVVLTEDGATVAEYAERILALVQDLDRRTGGRRELRGPIRLGIPDTFALMCLGTMFRDLDTNYPELSVAVTVENSRILTSRLEEGALDIVVIVEPAAMRSMKMEHLAAHQLIWVAAPNIMPVQMAYTPQDFMTKRILTNPAPSNTFTLIMDWFDDHYLVPPRMCYCNSIAVILDLVASGAGISAVPRCLARTSLADGQLIELTTDEIFPIQNFFIVSRRSSTNPGIAVTSRAIRTAVASSLFAE